MKMFKSFLKSKRGNVSITFGIALVPLIAAAGVAVDMQRATLLKSKLTIATDNAALAAVSSDVTDLGELTKIVKSHLKNNNIKDDYSEPIVKVQELESGNLEVKLTTKLNTNLMRIVGKKHLDVNVTSVVARDYGNIDVALVLDTTNSMKGEKIKSLKTAAKNMINILHEAKASDSVVRFGIAPFAEYVNIGLKNRNAPWVDVPNDYTETKNIRTRDVIKKYKCVTKTGTYDDDGIPTEYTYESCKYKYGPWYRKDIEIVHTWNGCVGSRDYPWDTRHEGYGIKIPGLVSKSCVQRVTEMTEDKATLIQDIDSLFLNRVTYIPTGLMWGWRLVSAKEPFSLNSLSAPGVGKINNIRSIVLMTDGANSHSASYPLHNKKGGVGANKLTKEICENIKKSEEEIIIYTVAFQVKGKNTKAMLKNCATSPSHYFSAGNAAELSTAFKDIAKSLSQLRIAQ